MRFRVRGLAVAISLVSLGCAGEEQAGEGGQPLEVLPIAGMYQVSGTTVDIHTGSKRDISGKLILAENGDRYTATFSLATTYPGADEVMPAEVIGNGEGEIDGRELRGTAHTQLVMATVPGVDPGFAFVPRMVSTRIKSTSVATIAADGSVAVEIENTPAEGEQYSPTRTSLRGVRVSAAGLGDELNPEE